MSVITEIHYKHLTIRSAFQRHCWIDQLTLTSC